MKPGCCVNIPSGVKHCHGAAPDSWFSHLAIEIPGKDGSNEWLEVVTDEQYKILKDLVGFDTVNDKENKEILNYIEDFLKGLGFETQHKDKNLVMSIGSEYKFGFLGHTDTVEYINGWHSNPFEIVIKDEKARTFTWKKNSQGITYDKIYKTTDGLHWDEGTTKVYMQLAFDTAGM